MALHPHTRVQYQRQFKLFLAFAISRHFTVLDQVPVLLVFIEFLVAHTLSHRVILNYISALKYMFARYGWNSEIFQAPLIQRMLQGIRLTTRQVISPKGVFTLPQLKSIIYACAHFPDPLLYRSAFLLAFYAFYRISNIAPPFLQGI